MHYFKHLPKQSGEQLGLVAHPWQRVGGRWASRFLSTQTIPWFHHQSVIQLNSSTAEAQRSYCLYLDAAIYFLYNNQTWNQNLPYFFLFDVPFNYSQQTKMGFGVLGQGRSLTCELPTGTTPFPKTKEPVLLSLHWTALICFPLIKATPLTWTQISNENKLGANISTLPLQQKLTQIPLTLLFPHPQKIHEAIPAFSLPLFVTAHGWFHL